ncbi:group-specific protein [Paenibacillus sp. NPDC058177]|uniref:group-specific protein n=1 Tax=Paenibacillus sp. NPDC058177 TaxID=3346369 RepID=UPI0036D95340
MSDESALVTINIDKSRVLIICRDEIKKLLNDIDNEYIFWDTRELKKRTCMSWNTIQDTFFFDARFLKHKVGGKWYYPVKETRNFLEQWLSEQP